MVGPLSQSFQLESEITKKEYGNFYLPLEFDLNNISSIFLVLQLYFKALSRLHIKISSLWRFNPDLQGHLATIEACMVSKYNLFHRKYGFVNTFANPMMHHLTDFVTKLYLSIPKE